MPLIGKTGSITHLFCFSEKPQWELVFKAVAGIASPDETDPLLVDPYALWHRDAPYNEEVPDARKLDLSYKGHFKSSLLTNWPRRHILEVRLGLFLMTLTKVGGGSTNGLIPIAMQLC